MLVDDEGMAGEYWRKDGQCAGRCHHRMFTHSNASAKVKTVLFQNSL